MLLVAAEPKQELALTLLLPAEGLRVLDLLPSHVIRSHVVLLTVLAVRLAANVAEVLV